MPLISQIKLNLAQRLKDRKFRHRFFQGRTRDEIAMSIRELREMRNLRQADLAKGCSMKQSAISRIESTAYSGWNMKTLLRIAEALDVRIKVEFEPMEAVVKRYEEREKEKSGEIKSLVGSEFLFWVEELQRGTANTLPLTNFTGQNVPQPSANGSTGDMASMTIPDLPALPTLNSQMTLLGVR